jgi:hypothetical protein
VCYGGVGEAGRRKERMEKRWRVALFVLLIAVSAGCGGSEQQNDTEEKRSLPAPAEFAKV